MVDIVIRVGNDLIESVTTKRSADKLNLKVGDALKAVIKSTEVMLEKDYKPSHKYENLTWLFRMAEDERWKPSKTGRFCRAYRLTLSFGTS
jgi:hypothetical protein